MTDTLDKLPWLNALPEKEAIDELLRCCGSRLWARGVALVRPFKSPAALFTCADRLWDVLAKEDRLEAFSHHPRLGDVSALQKRWVGEEQQGTAGAPAEVLKALAEGNAAYEKKFGFVFLLCATGKSAEEMLAALENRLPNDAATELAIASKEQAKITRLRLEKLLR